MASYIFYGWWDYRFLGLLWSTTLVDYFAAKQLSRSHDPTRRRAWLILSITSNLTVLGVFKYFNFFVDSLASLLSLLGLPGSPHLLRIVLPVGISFYTFQSISYVVDVYRGDLEPVKGLRDFALFVAYFPHLVAGPIVRTTILIPQFQRDRGDHASGRERLLEGARAVKLTHLAAIRIRSQPP